MGGIETEQPFINFAPIREHLLTTMSSIESLTAEQVDKNGMYVEPAKAHLKRVIDSTSSRYYERAINIRGVHESLLGFKESDDLANPLRSRYQRFIEDLGYVSLLEAGGLDAVNKELRTSFGHLDMDHTETAINRINDLLGRAIHLYPHIALGVQIDLPIEKRLPDFNQSYLDFKDGRNAFKKMSQIWQATRNKHLENLTLPLPYSTYKNDELTKDRGVFLPDDASVGIFFTLLRDSEDQQVPGLAVQIGPDDDSCICPMVSYFAMEEVGDVKLVTGERNIDFTPEFEHEDGVWNLKPRSNWIRHYLGFRGFGEPEYEISDSAYYYDKANLYNQFLLVPSNNSELTRSKENRWTGNYDIKQGFIALITEEMRLYEVTGANGYGKNFRTSAPNIISKIFRGFDETFARKHVKRYEGKEIVERLAAIPRGL